VFRDLIPPRDPGPVDTVPVPDPVHPDAVGSRRELPIGLSLNNIAFNAQLAPMGRIPAPGLNLGVDPFRLDPPMVPFASSVGPGFGTGSNPASPFGNDTISSQIQNDITQRALSRINDPAFMRNAMGLNLGVETPSIADPFAPHSGTGNGVLLNGTLNLRGNPASPFGNDAISSQIQNDITQQALSRINDPAFMRNAPTIGNCGVCTNNDAGGADIGVKDRTSSGLPNANIVHLSSRLTSTFPGLIGEFSDNNAGTPIITSGNDSKHAGKNVPGTNCSTEDLCRKTSNSAHYRNIAYDVRANHLNAARARKLRLDIANRLGPGYDVLLESIGTVNQHIHIEAK